jgi:hypothetical protein
MVAVRGCLGPELQTGEEEIKKKEEYFCVHSLLQYTYHMVLHYTSIGFGPDGGSLYKSMPWKNYYAAALAKLLARSSDQLCSINSEQKIERTCSNGGVKT